MSTPSAHAPARPTATHVATGTPAQPLPSPTPLNLRTFGALLRQVVSAWLDDYGPSMGTALVWKPDGLFKAG